MLPFTPSISDSNKLQLFVALLTILAASLCHQLYCRTRYCLQVSTTLLLPAMLWISTCSSSHHRLLVHPLLLLLGSLHCCCICHVMIWTFWSFNFFFWFTWWFKWWSSCEQPLILCSWHQFALKYSTGTSTSLPSSSRTVAVTPLKLSSRPPLSSLELDAPAPFPFIEGVSSRPLFCVVLCDRLLVSSQLLHVS